MQSTTPSNLIKRATSHVGLINITGYQPSNMRLAHPCSHRHHYTVIVCNNLEHFRAYSCMVKADDGRCIEPPVFNASSIHSNKNAKMVSRHSMHIAPPIKLAIGC